MQNWPTMKAVDRHIPPTSFVEARMYSTAYSARAAQKRVASSPAVCWGTPAVHAATTAAAKRGSVSMAFWCAEYALKHHDPAGYCVARGFRLLYRGPVAITTNACGLVGGWDVMS